MDVLIANLCEVELGDLFGSARKSISTILPLRIVTAAIQNGCPWKGHPGGAVDERAAHRQVDPRPQQRPLRDGLLTPDVLR